jgi:hypothetical protein
MNADERRCENRSVENAFIDFLGAFRTAGLLDFDLIGVHRRSSAVPHESSLKDGAVV